MSIKSGAVLFIFVALFMIGCNTGKDNNPVIKIVPGKYKFTVTRDDFDGRGAQLKETETCFKEAEYQPYKERYENELCEISEFNRTGSSVSYDIACNADVAIGMSGTISYGYANEVMRWSFKAVGTNESKVYSFEVNGEAKWIGECEDDTIKPF